MYILRVSPEEYINFIRDEETQKGKLNNKIIRLEMSHLKTCSKFPIDHHVNVMIMVEGNCNSVWL